jgi:hypothetical protein
MGLTHEIGLRWADEFSSPYALILSPQDPTGIPQTTLSFGSCSDLPVGKDLFEPVDVDARSCDSKRSSLLLHRWVWTR